MQLKHANTILLLRMLLHQYFPVVKIHVTDVHVVKDHVEELSYARISQHKLCATLSANVNINYRLPIKEYYRICTLRHIKIEINHGSQN